MTFLIALVCIMLLALFLIIYGSIAKNRWGINLDPVRCPRCGVLRSLCIGVQFSWRAIGVGLLSMLSVRYWGLGPVKESTG
jgi:hypothetical protein